MSNEKHYPLHPNSTHPPVMTCEIPLEEYESLKRENAELKAKLESVQASMYADNVDLGMKLRKTQCALWLARAAFYCRSVEWLSGIMSHCLVGQIDLYKKCEQRKNRYMKAFNKCRNKAKEYE